MTKTADVHHHDLLIEQAETLGADRMRPGPAAFLLFRTMDLMYGRSGSLPKFRVLEVIARVPYIAWEQVAYVAITHTHSTPAFARQIHDEVRSYRGQQDNELFHLLILEELLQQQGQRLGVVRHRVLPQIIAWVYYHVSWLLYVLRPAWSHALNAQFEDHAEHEYMEYVRDHPDLDGAVWNSRFREDYGDLATVADVLRHIGLDERHHKLESLERIGAGRFERIDVGSIDHEEVEKP